jgi:hypothetical protein
MKGYYFSDAQTTATTIDGVSTDVMVWPSNGTVGGPGCTLGCGNCALQGETVELIFWPPATLLANNTVTGNSTGPVTVEALGTTFTSPTVRSSSYKILPCYISNALQVYISFDSLWARNSCSKFGRTITNAIVPITKTEDMSSLYGYGALMGGRQMSASFNFTDLYQDPVPDEIYERQPRCWLSSRAAQGGRYRPLPSDYPGCARTAPYEPILVIPMEVRELDPEWASCRGGIEGVYDPPCKYTVFRLIYDLTNDLATVALRPAGSIVVPTKPVVRGTTSTAAPLPTHSSDQAPKTTQDPVPISKPTASQALPPQDTASDPPLPQPTISDPPAQSPAADPLVQDPAADPSPNSAGQAPKETPKTTKGNGHNVWPPPVSDFEIPETIDALSILKSALASAQATGAADLNDSDPSQHQSAGQQEHSEDDHPDGTEDPSDPNDSTTHAANDPSEPEQVGAVWMHEGETFTAIMTDGSAIVHGESDITTIAAGRVQTFGGQAISVPFGGNHVNVDGSVLSFDPIAKATGAGLGTTPTAAILTAAAVWTHESEVFTAILTDGSAVVQGGGRVTTVAPGQVEMFKGQAISIPLEGNLVKVDNSAVSFGRVTASEQANNEAKAIFTVSGQAITAMLQGSSLVLQASGSTTTIAYRADGTIAGQKVAFPTSPSNVIEVNGQSITMQALASGGSKATLSASAVWTHGGETFTAQIQGDSAIVLEAPSTTMRIDPGSALTIGNTVYSVPAAGGVLVHDGTPVTLDRAVSTGSAAIAATSADDSSPISAFDAGNSVIVVVDDKTITLADGAQTSLDHHVVSARSTGGLVVVDGTTLAASTRASVTRSSDSVGSSNTGDPTATSGSTSDSAATTNVSVRVVTTLIFFGIATIAWI